MPVMKKEIELEDGTKIWVRQASGTKKLKIQAIQSRVFRKFSHFGDPAEWTLEQNEEFAEALDVAGAGFEAQVDTWLGDCIIDSELSIDDLTTEELMLVLNFVRGDDPDGAVPLSSS